MTYHGIAGVDGVEPIGAVLRVGIRKPGSGEFRQPINRDRFYIAMPRVDSTNERPLHPGFVWYHKHEAEKRQLVKCVIVHATVTEAFSYYLQAWRLPVAKADHPPRGAACTGDGVDATRWDPKAQEFRQIRCPNERCEYRLGRAKTPKPCKPFARLLFRPVWTDAPLPTPLMKFETRSWNSTKAILGLFKHLEDQARNLGVESPSLYGFPFSLQLSEEANKAEGTRYPVVRPTPLIDVQSFLVSQRQAAIHVEKVASMLDAREHDHESISVANRELGPSPATDGAT